MRPSDFSRSGFRWSRCGRISAISTVVWRSGLKRRRRRPLLLNRRAISVPIESERKSGFLSGSSRSPRQTLAFHPPDQEVDPILAEERLAFEYESRHAPMARGGVVPFIARNDPLVTIGIGDDCGIHRGEVEAGGGRRLGEMVAFVPAGDTAVPQ